MKPPLQKRVPKPRNPFVMLAKERKAGSHAKPEAASRRALKVALARGKLD